MKIGSLVQCIASTWKYPVSSITYPEEGEIYVVRGTYRHENSTGLVLEEIINTPIGSKIGEYGEPCFSETAFVELQPPTHIDINEFLNI